MGVVTESAWTEPDFDVVITSAAGFEAIAALCAGGPPAPLGAVATVVAVPDPGTATGDPGTATGSLVVAVGGGLPDAEDNATALTSASDLRALLLAAPAVYCADLARSTSGRLLTAVLDTLGIGSAVIPRLHVYGSGTESMPALAAAESESVGLAQLSEVVAVAGVRALRRDDGAAALPGPFARSTTYVAAVGARSRSIEAARRWIRSVTGSEAAAQRAACGFAPAGE